MSNAHRESSARSEKLALWKLGRSYNCCETLGSNADRMSGSFPNVHCSSTEEEFNFFFLDPELSTIKNTFWWNLKEKKLFEETKYVVYLESVFLSAHLEYASK